MDDNAHPLTPINNLNTVTPTDRPNFFKRYWLQLTLLIIAGILSLSVIILVITQNRTSNNSTSSPTTTATNIPLPTSNQLVQQPFKILSTSPKDQEKNVFAGELVISLTTDVPIVASSSLSLEFTPPLKYYTKFISSFPTKTVMAQVLGGLDTNTRYSIAAKDKTGKKIYIWSFTTSSDVGQGHSALNSELDKQTFETYYPLEKYFPYSTNDYSLGYVDHFKVKITLKHPGLNEDTILNEVKAWVKSKGVDPSTHQFIFVKGY
ncbi:MAG TPA: hypothetical protein VG935_05005 [Patescibacteria group bacterium]|nr:hypothetical protein [Patescibacteria group bacterium]